jgi:hypothetical protein
MNELRHFLSRGTLTARCLFFVVFAVLMSRALLSSVVMLDADAPVGSFGLVICSGHGPMFPNAIDKSSPVAMQMDSGMMMDMPGMAMPSTSDKTSQQHGAMDEQPDSNSLCPFSAAFLTAITVTAFVSLILFLIVVTLSWAPPAIASFVASSPHRRPRTRAPPFPI